MKVTGFSFGGTSAIVTSMGIIVGFDAATMTRASILSGLLIIALADNLSDSLSIHVYQEAERLEERSAFRATLSNFVARLVISASFVALVWLLPSRWMALVATGWGLLLLGALSWLVARARRASAAREIAKHLLIAALVLGVSRAAAAVITAAVH